MLTDIGGNVVNIMVYDAYGNLIASNGVLQTGYLYSGQQFDYDLGLYYNRARLLNPNTGRFWTADTTDGNNEDPLSLHKYLYAGDDPVDRSDPSGHDWDTFFNDQFSVKFAFSAQWGFQGAFLAVDQSRTDSSGVILTGSEPRYNPDLWNSSDYSYYNNCYSYAVNDPVPEPARSGVPQPGYKAFGTMPGTNDVTISGIRSRAVADGLVFLGMSPNQTLTTPMTDYVIALVVDPSVDYHWYRHGPDGMWSSKHGWDNGPANNTDAVGHVIPDPRVANESYGPNLDYTDWGGYFAVPPHMVVKP
jgi:RHS repeat-associated protein